MSLFVQPTFYFNTHACALVQDSHFHCTWVRPIGMRLDRERQHKKKPQQASATSCRRAAVAPGIQRLTAVTDRSLRVSSSRAKWQKNQRNVTAADSQQSRGLPWTGTWGKPVQYHV